MSKVNADGRVVDVSYGFKTEALQVVAQLLRLCDLLGDGNFSNWDAELSSAEAIVSNTKDTVLDDEEDTILLKLDAQLAIIRAKVRIVLLQSENNLPYDLDGSNERTEI